MAFDVRSLDSGLIDDVSRTYDLFVCTSGYESRARHVSQRLGRRVTRTVAYAYAGIDFADAQLNRSYFESVGEVVDVDDHLLRKDLADRVAAIRENLLRHYGTSIRPIHIAVDISSMDRDRLALTVQSLLLDSGASLQIDFYYSFARYESALVGSEGAVLVNRPVRGMEGWTEDPERPLSLIVGLGFESRLAVAALDTLEPSYLHLMIPSGEDPRYDEIVRERNSALLNSGSVDRVEYNATLPFRSLLSLDSLVHADAQSSRVAIVPLGPKVFALAAVLVGLRNDRDVTVWRLSAGSGRSPENREATGTVVGLRVDK